jgi:hypothetical protein
VGIDAVEEQPRHRCVMGSEPAGQRLGHGRDLATQGSLGQIGDHGGITLAGDQRCQRADGRRPQGYPVFEVGRYLVRRIVAASNQRFRARRFSAMPM